MQYLRLRPGLLTESGSIMIGMLDIYKALSLVLVRQRERTIN